MLPRSTENTVVVLQMCEIKTLRNSDNFHRTLIVTRNYLGCTRLLNF